MKPRKVRTWIVRVLVAAGVAAGILFAAHAAQADEMPAENEPAIVQHDPEWT